MRGPKSDRKHLKVRVLEPSERLPELGTSEMEGPPEKASKVKLLKLSSPMKSSPNRSSLSPNRQSSPVSKQEVYKLKEFLGDDYSPLAR